MSALIILSTTSPGNARLGIRPHVCGEFTYRFDSYAEARDVVAVVLTDESRRRPRQRRMGKDRWLLDHPRQRSIYPLTVTIVGEVQDGSRVTAGAVLQSTDERGA